MYRFITASVLAAALSLPVVLPAAAAGNPSGTGQPNQTCLSSTAPLEPGRAASAPRFGLQRERGYRR